MNSQVESTLGHMDLRRDSSKSKIIGTHSRQDIILYEYKMLQMYGPLFGIYAIPNLSNFNIWNCIIFVRKGLYKNAKFKFDLILPSKFPKAAPQIMFASRICHPLVRESDGAVDIEQLLDDKWNYSIENMLYSVFAGLNRMFTDKNKMQVQNSFNPEAAQLFLTKPQLFIEKAFNSMQQSLDNLYVNAPGSSLVIHQYENDELEPFKHKLESLCQQNQAAEEKRKNFLDFVLGSDV